MIESDGTLKFALHDLNGGGADAKVNGASGADEDFEQAHAIR